MMKVTFEMADPARYITEIAYPAQFHREHAPVWLDAMMTALGRPSPAYDRGLYCEIGCGSGFNLCLLAATNPSIRFLGIDIYPQHVEDAKAMAQAAALTNVTFECGDVRDMQGIEACSVIIVRGIYSWVGKDVRGAIDDFIARQLMPGGIALVHYMALPGAADMLPVQRLFGALHRHENLSPAEAIKAGHGLMHALVDGRAGFFEAHPVAKMKLAQEQGDEIGHTVHDYLNDAYEPLLSADVIAAMDKLGLGFAGSATPFDNLDDFTVPGSMRALVNAQPSLGLREAAKDFASNQFARIDLYQRDATPLSSDHHVAALRGLKLRALVDMPGRGGVTFDTRIGKVEGPAELFDPITAALRSGTVAGYSEIEQLPAFARHPGLVNQAFHALIGAGAAHPVPARAADPEAARRLNGVLLARHQMGRSVPALAAPSIGSGIAVSREDLDALSSGKDVRRNLAFLLP